MRFAGVAATTATLFALVATTASAPAAEPERKPVKKGGPGCIYGQVVDGHSGEVRCLSPEEVAPPAPYDTPTEPADAGADASHDAAADARRSARDAAIDVNPVSPIPLRGLSVSIEGLSFDGGDVPRAPLALDRIKKDFTRCVGDGALRGEGTIELRFLVRAPGRAEGVDVAQSRGVSGDAVRCVAAALAGRVVGAPTADPVGVSITVRFKKE
jgi:hypothetical protein